STVTITDFHFSYGRTTIFSGLNLEISEGITVLLGPNGAGKTTLMKAIVGLLKPKRGTIQTSGRIGYLEQRFETMDGLRTDRHVAYAAWAAGLPRTECYARADAALASVSLGDKSRSKVKHLSGGQRQRLGLACTLVSDPSVVVLDEPTVGVDPAQRVEIRKQLLAASENTTTIVSTHLVDDAARMADRIIVLNSGVIAFDGTVAELEDFAPQGLDSRTSELEAGYLEVLDA
ncbi:MAG: ABC transporter ATP-binding protein, partial [Ancrocorticia populi]